MTTEDPEFCDFIREYAKLCPKDLEFFYRGDRGVWVFDGHDLEHRRRIRRMTVKRFFHNAIGNVMNTKQLLRAIGTSIVIGVGLVILSFVLRTLVWIYTL